MAARNTISRLTSRIDDLAERRLPRRGPVTIVGGDEAECRRRLQEIEAAGEQIGHVRFIVTGVTRAESRPVPVDVGPRRTNALKKRSSPHRTKKSKTPHQRGAGQQRASRGSGGSGLPPQRAF